MYKNFLVIAFASLLALNTAIASNHQDSEKIKIDVNINPDRTVRITNASAIQKAGEIKISGILRPKNWTARTVGHVHVSLLGADGTVVKTFIVEPNKKVFMRKSSHRPRFKLSIPATDSTITEVVMKHHKATSSKCS